MRYQVSFIPGIPGRLELERIAARELAMIVIRVVVLADLRAFRRPVSVEELQSIGIPVRELCALHLVLQPSEKPPSFPKRANQGIAHPGWPHCCLPPACSVVGPGILLWQRHHFLDMLSAKLFIRRLQNLWPVAPLKTNSATLTRNEHCFGYGAVQTLELSYEQLPNRPCQAALLGCFLRHAWEISVHNVKPAEKHVGVSVIEALILSAEGLSCRGDVELGPAFSGEWHVHDCVVCLAVSLQPQLPFCLLDPIDRPVVRICCTFHHMQYTIKAHGHGGVTSTAAHGPTQHWI
mmetsp:Transcript_20369/g.36423  ORF Transcript_20369/g.36423 Transcript_20369/m.36423 type:complete len:292 (-) Transcript_20369:926-1801(-)